jgi:large subunit ribosomal protein L24
MANIKIKLNVGDTVLVRKGKDKGKSGKIVAVHPTENKVTVEGVNIVKKHQKPTQANPRGGIFELTKPIWIANVGIVNPTDSKKTSRIGYEVSKDGSKKRVYIQASRKEIK